MTWLDRQRLTGAATSAPGQIVLLGLNGTLLVHALGPAGWLLGAAVAVAMLRPTWRRPILTVASVAILAVSLSPGLAGLSLAMSPQAWRSAVFVAAWIGVLLLWARWPDIAGSHALLVLHAAAIAIVCATSLVRGPSAVGWCILSTELLWRSAYWVQWRRRQPGQAKLLINLFTCIPFLGAGGVPFGKGPGYLSRHEAMDNAARGRCLIDGTWLLLLAAAWHFAAGHLPDSLALVTIPDFRALLTAPDDVALWRRWASLLAELLRAILTLGVQGHTVVGFFCLMGFHIPRNTQAPLLAETMLDFWNRYFFYFKELLVDFFFFPTFASLSGRQQTVRLLMATWAAAFAGNLYFHALLYAPVAAKGHPDVWFDAMSVRAVYCGALATALSVSALLANRRRRAAQRPWPLRAVRIAGVWTMFALLHAWSADPESASVHQRLELMRALL